MARRIAWEVEAVLFVKVPRTLHRQFRIRCLKRRESVTAAITRLVRDELKAPLVREESQAS